MLPRALLIFVYEPAVILFSLYIGALASKGRAKVMIVGGQTIITGYETDLVAGIVAFGIVFAILNLPVAIVKWVKANRVPAAPTSPKKSNRELLDEFHARKAAKE